MEITEEAREEIKHRTIKKTGEMISSLQKAYHARPEDISLQEEKQMLEIMAATKKLADSVKKVFIELDKSRCSDQDKQRAKD